MSNLDIASYNRQRKVFMVANQAAKATTAVSTTYTGLVLYNPWGSGKRIVIVDASWMYSTVPTAAGGVILAMPSSVSSAATPAGTAEPIYYADGSGVATVNAGKAFTIATLPVVNVHIRPLATLASAATANTPTALPEGGLHIVPGSYISMVHITTVATGIGSYMWVEVPE